MLELVFNVKLNILLCSRELVVNVRASIECQVEYTVM